MAVARRLNRASGFGKSPTLSYHPNPRKIGVSWEPRLPERMGYKRHLRENDLIAQCVAQPLRPQRELRLRVEKRRKGWGLSAH